MNIRALSSGNSSVRLNFNLNIANKIHHHSQNDHLIISKTAKFGREFWPESGAYTKLAHFARVNFPHFTTFRDQTLQFY